MDEDLKDSLKDTAKALPLVALTLGIMLLGFIIGSRLVWGNWPF